MNELDVRHLLHQSKAKWRFGRYHRDVRAVCEQALTLMEAEAQAVRRQHLAELETVEVRRQLDEIRRDHHALKEGVPTLVEAIRRLKNGKDDNGKMIPPFFLKR